MLSWFLKVHKVRPYVLITKQHLPKWKPLSTLSSSWFWTQNEENQTWLETTMKCWRKERCLIYVQKLSIKSAFYSFMLFCIIKLQKKKKKRPFEKRQFALTKKKSIKLLFVYICCCQTCFVFPLQIGPKERQKRFL